MFCPGPGHGDLARTAKIVRPCCSTEMRNGNRRLVVRSTRHTAFIWSNQRTERSLSSYCSRGEAAAPQGGQ